MADHIALVIITKAARIKFSDFVAIPTISLIKSSTSLNSEFHGLTIPTESQSTLVNSRVLFLCQIAALRKKQFEIKRRTF